MTHGFFGADLPGLDPSAAASLRAFKRSMVLHRRLLGALLSGEPLHPAQAGGLQVLAHHDGIGQSELAAALHVSRPTVTVMLQKMETAGLVERRADGADSRITRVFLTEAGRAQAARMHEVVAQVLDLSMGTLSPEERAELTRLLEKMNDNVSAALAERGIPAHGHHAHETEDSL